MSEPEVIAAFVARAEQIALNEGSIDLNGALWGDDAPDRPDFGLRSLLSPEQWGEIVASSQESDWDE